MHNCDKFIVARITKERKRTVQQEPQEPGHILSAEQFEKDFVDLIFNRTREIQDILKSKNLRKSKVWDAKGDVLIDLFGEPSTRTLASFSLAGKYMGMNVLDLSHAKKFSSAMKGESLEDEIQVLCGYYPDVITLRYDEVNSAHRAAEVSSVPIINAGDGAGEHPTQSLLDLYTIKQEVGSMSSLTVVIGGDLRYGRTVQSLARLLSKYERNYLIFVSPPELTIGEDLKRYLRDNNIHFEETDDLNSFLPFADVVYWTRTQSERHEKGRNSDFVITPYEMSLMKQSAILLHPLPRVGEVTEDCDSDPRAAYFRQAAYGLPLRMALLEWILGYDSNFRF